MMERADVPHDTKRSQWHKWRGVAERLDIYRGKATLTVKETGRVEREGTKRRTDGDVIDRKGEAAGGFVASTSIERAEAFLSLALRRALDTRALASHIP